MTDGINPVELRAELERLVLNLLGPSDPHELLPAVRTPVRVVPRGDAGPAGTIVDPSSGSGRAASGSPATERCHRSGERPGL